MCGSRSLITKLYCFLNQLFWLCKNWHVFPVMFLRNQFLGIESCSFAITCGRIMYITVTILGRGGEGRLIVTHFFALKSRCLFFIFLNCCWTCSECVPEDQSPWYRGEGRVLKSGEKAVPALFNTSLGIKQSLTPRSMSPDSREVMRDHKSELFVIDHFLFYSFGAIYP